MAKVKRHVYKKQRQPIYGIFTNVFKIFLHKPKFINHNEELPQDGLLVGLHMGKWGPFYMSQYMPFKFAVIGAHPMLGSFKERWHYLRDVLYIQKQHKSKFASTLKASFEAFFSKGMYKGMHVIPSYEDMRLLHTIHDASETMNNGLPVMIFPENSDNGYQKVLTECHEGFITIAKFVSKKRQKETPIYPFYVHVRRKILVIRKPYYLSQFEGKSNEEILNYTRDRVNELNPWFEEDKKDNQLYPIKRKRKAD